MSAHLRRPPRRGFQILLAACAVLGIGAVATTAAWTHRATFRANSTVAGFQMEYSYYGGTAVENWHAFPTDTETPIRLTQWTTSMRPGDAAQTHSIFIRNTASPNTTVTFEPELTGVFASESEPDFIVITTGLNLQNPTMTRWESGSVDVYINEWNQARIDLKFDPQQLTSSATTREGSLTLTVTGTVGTAAPPDEGTGTAIGESSGAAPFTHGPARREWA